MWTWMAVAALAGAPDARGIGAPELTGVAFAVDALPVALPELHADLGRGYAFEVAWDGAPAGFVWVGEGAATVDLDGPFEAEAVANALAVIGGADPEALRPVVDARAWALPVDVAVVLSRDPAVLGGLALLDRVDALKAYTERADGVAVVNVVELDGLGAARRRARSALRFRVDRAAELGRDPRALLGTARAAGAPPTWASLHGPTDLGPLVEPYHAESVDDIRWLTGWRDPLGLWDPGRDGEVAVLALDAQKQPVARSIARSEDPPSAADLALDARIARARLDAWGGAVEAGIALDTSVLVSAPRPLDEVVLALPRVRQLPFANLPALDSGFEVVRVTDEEGRPLRWRWLDPSDARDKTDVVEIAVELGATLPPGEAAAIRVRTNDNARLRHFLIVSRGGHEEVIPLGNAMAPASAVVRVVGVGGVPAPTLLQVAHTGSKGLTTVQSGRAVDVQQVGALEVRGSLVAGHRAHVALGDWTVHHRDDVGVSAALLPDQARAAEGLAAQAVQTTAFLADVLPPSTEPLTLVEPARPPVGLVWTAPLGDIAVMPAGDSGGRIGVEGRLRSSLPALEWMALATARASQHFGWAEDPDVAWMGPAFGRAYGELLVREAFGDADASAWRSLWRGCGVASGPATGPLDLRATTRSAPAGSPCAAALLAGPTLRGAVGEAAWLRGVDRLVRARPEGDAVDALADALTVASGRDVHGLVDFWVRGGVAPAVDVRWSVDQDAVAIDVIADVPYGVFDVPITVRSRDGAVAEVAIEVRDGRGTASVAAASMDRPSVEVDPGVTVLLRDVAVRRVGPR